MLKMSKKELSILSSFTAIKKVDEEYKKEFEMMSNSNYIQEKKTKGSRDLDLVKKHTAAGFGAERALLDTGIFKPGPSIVEDPYTLSYEERKYDLLYKKYKIEVKTCKNRLDKLWYLSYSQLNSIKSGINFADAIIVMFYDELGNLTYNYQPRYLVDTKSFLDYIKGVKARYSDFIYDFDGSIKDGNCVEFIHGA